MRGSSQSFMVQGTDDRSYVMKCADNPQGTRTLINEWIVGELLMRFGICTPQIRVLVLEGTTEGMERLYFTIGDTERNVEGRFHIGSQCPVSPDTTAIYDFLPSRLLSRVINLADFASVLVLDKWLCHIDRRQTVFVREPDPDGSSIFKAYFIDHGLCFAGSRWELDVRPHGMYIDAGVYSRLNLTEHTLHALSALHIIEEDYMSDVVSSFPQEWLSEGDDAALANLLESLQRRRRKVASLVEQCVREISSRGVSPHASPI